MFFIKGFKMTYSLATDKPLSDSPQLTGVLSVIKGWKGDWRKFFTAQEHEVEEETVKMVFEEDWKPIVVSGIKKDIITPVHIDYDPVVYGHMKKPPDIDINDMSYVIRQIASHEHNAVNLDTFTEMWHFSDFCSGYQKGAGLIRLMMYYSALHNREFDSILQVPEIMVTRAQLSAGGNFVYGRHHTYAWTVNSRHAVLETLRHIHFLKKNGVVYYDDFDGRHWFIKEQPQCNWEIVHAIKEKHGCISLKEYNNGMKVMVTPRTVN